MCTGTVCIKQEYYLCVQVRYVLNKSTTYVYRYGMY